MLRWGGKENEDRGRGRVYECIWGNGWYFCFVLRTTSVSPLDRDKDTLSLTRKNAVAFFRKKRAEMLPALLGVGMGGYFLSFFRMSS